MAEDVIQCCLLNALSISATIDSEIDHQQHLLSDLSVAYYIQHLHGRRTLTATDLMIAKKKAIQCSITSVKMNPRDTKSRLAFAMICAGVDVSQYQLSQHLFVKALILNDAHHSSSQDNLSIIWSNLAVVYLIGNKPLLSIKALKQSELFDDSNSRHDNHYENNSSSSDQKTATRQNKQNLNLRRLLLNL